MIVHVVREGERGESSRIVGVYRTPVASLAAVASFCESRSEAFKRDRGRETPPVVAAWCTGNGVDQVWVERHEVQS